MTAAASPPPMQSVANPSFFFFCFMAEISVTNILAPEAPIGCPIDTAPPCTFTFSWGILCSRIAANVTFANASLTSNKSISLMESYDLSKTFEIAFPGAVVK